MPETETLDKNCNTRSTSDLLNQLVLIRRRMVNALTELDRLVKELTK